MSVRAKEEASGYSSSRVVLGPGLAGRIWNVSFIGRRLHTRHLRLPIIYYSSSVLLLTVSVAIII